VDMPRSPGILNEETLFLQSIVSTNGREHSLSVSDRYLILKLRLRNADPWSLDGERRDVISGDPNPNLAVLVCGDQTVAESQTLRTANCLHSSLVTRNLRSISTRPWCNCSFDRSDFSRTDIHALR